jgi:hypothetical protein
MSKNFRSSRIEILEKLGNELLTDVSKWGKLFKELAKSKNDEKEIQQMLLEKVKEEEKKNNNEE